jgi:serine/threonine-protein kinase
MKTVQINEFLEKNQSMFPPHNTPPVHMGEIIADKYRVNKILGEGGMGVVVEATHLNLKTKVAIKFLHRNLANDPEVLNRFLREARAACHIQNEHVVKILDVEKRSNGHPYVVMEHLEGQNLEEIINQWVGAPFPIKAAVDFILQACEALAEAHSLGITHRDIKPTNIFVTRRRDGRPLVKVLDFGVAKVSQYMTGSVRSLTKSLSILGTPEYMAPEQMLSAKTVDHRADIWSIGMTLYELLTRHTAHESDSLPVLCLNITNKPPLPPSFWRSDIPKDLERVILSCLEKDMDLRPQTLAELARSLMPFASRHGIASVAHIEEMLGCTFHHVVERSSNRKLSAVALIMVVFGPAIVLAVFVLSLAYQTDLNSSTRSMTLGQSLARRYQQHSVIVVEDSPEVSKSSQSEFIKKSIRKSNTKSVNSNPWKELEQFDRDENIPVVSSSSNEFLPSAP